MRCARCIKRTRVRPIGKHGAAKIVAAVLHGKMECSECSRTWRLRDARVDDDRRLGAKTGSGQDSAAPATSATARPQAETTDTSVANQPFTGDLDKDARAADDSRLRTRLQPVAVISSTRGASVGLGRSSSGTLSAGSTRNTRRSSASGRSRSTSSRRRATSCSPTSTTALPDIAVGNLTVTDERRKVVDFVAPDDKVVNVEIPRYRPRVSGDRLCR